MTALIDASGRIVEPSRDIPVARDTDVLVVGRGIASVMAALAAGRCGDTHPSGGALRVAWRDRDLGHDEPLLCSPTRIFRMAGVDVAAMLGYLRQHPEEMSLPRRWHGGLDYDPGDLEAPSIVMDVFPTLVAEARAAGELAVPRDRLGIETGPCRAW